MRILRHLMMDGRQSARQLALRLGMSTAAISVRIKKLEKEGVIGGYAAMISHEKLGYDLTAVIEIVAKNDKMLQIEDRIAKFENVCCVYDVTGATDTIIVAKFKTRGDLSAFVKTLGAIPNVKSTVTHLALNTIKEDFRMT